MGTGRRGREARERGLRRRGESRRRGGRGRHSTVVCPECRVSIPVMEGFNELPHSCPGCEAVLRCRACGSNLVEEDRTSGEDEEETPLERGDCPRCENPVTGEGADITDEDFTWKDT